MTTATTMARPSLWRFVIDHNPLYLLSAISMLAGCVLLSKSFPVGSARLWELLILLAVINVYEAALIGLGLYLMARRQLVSDARMLLILEALFLVDITFMNSELLTLNLAWGIAVNAVQLLLAAIKVAIIFRVLGISRQQGTFALILVQLAMLFAMAGIFRKIYTAHDALVPPGAMYAAWWIVGLIPAMWVLGRGVPFRFEGRHEWAGALARVVLPVYLVLPLASIITHLLEVRWVYRVPLYWGSFAPVLLGLAFMCAHLARRTIDRRVMLPVQFGLIAVALGLSLDYPAALKSLMYHAGGWGAVTPWRLALLASMLVYVESMRMHRRMYMVVIAGLCLLGVVLGPSLGAAVVNLGAMIAGTWHAFIASCVWIIATARRAIPRTNLGWGVMAVGGSFVLLALGALVSLRKRGPEVAETMVETVAEGGESA